MLSSVVKADWSSCCCPKKLFFVWRGPHAGPFGKRWSWEQNCPYKIIPLAVLHLLHLFYRRSRCIVYCTPSVNWSTPYVDSPCGEKTRSNFLDHPYAVWIPCNRSKSDMYSTETLQAHTASKYFIFPWQASQRLHVCKRVALCSIYFCLCLLSVLYHFNPPSAAVIIQKVFTLAQHSVCCQSMGVSQKCLLPCKKKKKVSKFKNSTSAFILWSQWLTGKFWFSVFHSFPCKQHSKYALPMILHCLWFARQLPQLF